MKPWINATVVCALWAVVNTSAFGVPSKRPLPKHILDSSADYLVLRDHLDGHSYYLIPKRYQVLANTLTPFGDQSKGCEAVAIYNQTHSTLLSAKNSHAKVSLGRAELINAILNQSSELDAKRTKLFVEKTEIEKALESLTGPGAEKEIDKQKKRLKQIEKEEGLFKQVLDRNQVRQKDAEAAQTEILNQIQNLEASLGEFSERIIMPAAKISFRSRLSVEDLTDRAFLETLGLKAEDSLHYPKLAALTLYPATDADLEFKEKSNREKKIGDFRPDWNLIPLKLQESHFGTRDLPSGMETREMPNEINFDRVLSLYSYCSIRGGLDPSKDLYSPLAVGFELMMWRDSPAAPTAPIVRRELFSYRSALTDAQWEKLVWKEEIREAAKVAPPLDPGHPSQFSGEGIYDRRGFEIKFDFSNLKPNVDGDKK